MQVDLAGFGELGENLYIAKGQKKQNLDLALHWSLLNHEMKRHQVLVCYSHVVPPTKVCLEIISLLSFIFSDLDGPTHTSKIKMPLMRSPISSARKNIFDLNT